MSARFDKLSILVLDDHRFMQQVLRALLTGMGVKNIVMAIDAEDAIRKAASEPFDLILADYRLDDGPSGAAFTRLVRASRDNIDRFVPIIACTADTTGRVIQELRDAGADEVLGKPVSAQALWSKITSVVNARRKFVAAPDFFGPDRRRRACDTLKGGERRKAR